MAVPEGMDGTDLFQSTPGSEEPGDTILRWAEGLPLKFQSTPGSEEPGDLRANLLLSTQTSFNPRPAPRSRAT